MGEGTDQPTTERRLTVSEAAAALGITPEAVRGRIRRGTLRAERSGGHVYVVLDADQPRPTGDQPTDRSELVEELRAHHATLREQLEAERQAHAEARRLLAAALERIPPQLEAPPEARERPEKATEEPERAHTAPVRCRRHSGARRAPVLVA
jgi:excisionase family DNA binding protein